MEGYDIVKRAICVMISCLMSVSLIHGRVLSAYEDAAESVLTNYCITCDNITTDQITKLSDNNPDTYAMLSPLLNSEIKITFTEDVSVDKVKIMAGSFSAWRSIKSLAIDYGNGMTSTLSVPYSKNGFLWVEDDVEYDEITQITVKVTEVYDNNYYTHGAIGEIQVCTDENANSGTDVGNAPRELINNSDFTLKYASSLMNKANNLFDEDANTVCGLSAMKDGFYVFQFSVPTDITEISFTSVVNGDWAVAKTFSLGGYNEETVYRVKLKNPEPFYSDKEYNAENSGKEQVFQINDEKLKGLTHLVIRIDDAYVNTKSTWGGWRNMKLTGVSHKESKSTDEIIKRNMPTNTEIMCAWGIINGQSEVVKETKVSRIDGAKTLLKLYGEYDKACNYKGSINFNDGASISEYENMLSYIFAYLRFAMQGDENNNFNPEDKLSAAQFYKIMLSMAGYICGEDYKWEDIKDFLHSKMIGSMIESQELNVKNMCSVIYEVLTLKIKNTDQLLIDYLHSKGSVPEAAWELFSDKFDKSIELSQTKYELPASANTNSDFKFSSDGDLKYISNTMFTYNAPFHYEGIYLGTLPNENPESKRKQFGEMLHNAGVMSLRFPGGTPTYQYFIEGKKYADMFYSDSERFSPGAWSALYVPGNKFKGFYVDFYDYLDFCKEYNIEPMFQINPGFYVDEAEERVRQVYPGVFTTKTADGVKTMTGYYDRDRSDEAAAQLGKNIDRLLARGYYIKYWEIGNEDFAVNYLNVPLSDKSNQYSIDFINAVTKYIKVIKEKIPDAYILMPQGWDYKQWMDSATYNMIGSVGYHYPFARWSQPPASEKGNPTYLVSMNECAMAQCLPKSYIAKNKEANEKQLSCTETTPWRFQGWTPGLLQNSFSMALNVAHNWGELVFDSGYCDVCVMHDLESVFFGYIEYDVVMDPAIRAIQWMKNDSALTVAFEDVPKEFIRQKQYYVNPAAYAMKILSHHSGEYALDSTETNIDRLVSAFASVDKQTGEISVTVVNRLEEEKTVRIAFDEMMIEPQSVSAEVMHSNFLLATFENEYSIIKQDISIEGNSQNNSEYDAVFNVSPYSVTHFKICSKTK